MRIGRQLVQPRRVAPLAAPDLGEAEEEALVAGQAVDHRGRLAVQRQVIRLVGDAQPRQVGDILAERQRALDVDAGERLVRVVLLDQTVGARGEGGGVGRRPPVAQRPLGVVLPPLVVEAVADLVADDDADRAVIDRRVGGGIEERRLQDRRGKDDLVHRRVVIGVDRHRRHAPLGAVERSPELGEVAVVVERLGPRGIADRIAGGDLQRRIVAPLRRVADLGVERRQLGARLRLGRRRHPVDLVDPCPHRGEQVVDQRVHRRLGVGGEVFGDVEPPDRLAHRAVDRVDAALPPWLVRRRARQDGAVEGEVLVDERLGQVGGTRLQRPQREIVAPDAERPAGDELRHAG